MRVRLFEDIFTGRHIETELEDGLNGNAVLSELGLDEKQAGIITPEGEVKDLGASISYPFISVYVIPKGATAILITAIIAITAIVTVGVLAACGVFNRMKSIPKTNAAASLRGSSNQARLNSRLPILLGRQKIFPDLAAQPYTSYESNEQFLHQVFCFGYSDAVIDTSTLKIGNTPIDKYQEVSLSYDPSTDLYPDRAIETYLGIELEKGIAQVRTTASGCWKAIVGITAPSGFYRYNDDGNKQAVNLGLKIEYKLSSSESWSIYKDSTESIAADVYRKAYALELTPGIYDIRDTRTTSKSSDSKYVDYIYWEILTCFTEDSSGNRYVIKTAGDYSLATVKIRASKQLNGTIDSLSAICTLNTTYYKGTAWVKGPTRNPASAVLYLLTNNKINPRAVDDSFIDWDSFIGFYQFCEKNGFTCDAYITSDYTIEELCNHICQSNLSNLVVKSSLISIRIDEAKDIVTQLFTPRNARSITMQRSFESMPKIIKAKFNSEDVEFTEVERTIRINDDDSFSFDTEIAADEEASEVNLFGVSSAEHAARVMAVRLKQMHTQTRTYSFETDIEGLVCLPGDVVLLSTDSFLYGLGEGRVTEISDDYIRVDADFTFVEGKEYGVKHRKADGTIESLKIDSFTAGTTSIINISGISFEVGDLVSFGYYKAETHKVQISTISIGSDKICQIQAVDYDPAVFSLDMSIPAYDPGISLYPEGTVIGQGKQDIPDRPGMPGAPGTSVKAITPYFLVSDKDSGITTETAGWSPLNAPLMDAVNRYLWQYLETEFSDGSKIKGEPFIVSVFGGKLQEYTYCDSTDPGAIAASKRFFKLGDKYIAIDGKALFEPIWYTFKDLPEKTPEYPCLWIRESSNGGITWDAYPITGPDGAPAIDFDISFNPPAFVNSSRRTDDLVIDIVPTFINLPETSSVAYTILEPVAGGITLDGSSVIIEKGYSPEFITVRAVLSSITKTITRELTIYGTESKDNEPMYLGKTNVMPPQINTYGTFLDGDWVFYNGADSSIYSYGHVYKKSGSDWIETTEMTKLLAVQDDAMKESQQNIFARVAFIKTLVAVDVAITGSFCFEKTTADGKVASIDISRDKGFEMRFGDASLGNNRPVIADFNFDDGTIRFGESFLLNPSDNKLTLEKTSIALEQGIGSLFSREHVDANS